MDQQMTLSGRAKGPRFILDEPKNNYLEQEKSDFLKEMNLFFDQIDFDETKNKNGRPNHDLKDIVKGICIMSYHGMSYRRSISDLNWMWEQGMIGSVPSKSSLNSYVNQELTRKTFEKLIQLSALFFSEGKKTLILDSTWFGLKMYSGGHKVVYQKDPKSLSRTRKLHISCFKKSKIIACAKSTYGGTHDSPFLRKFVSTIAENGFEIESVLADAGYSSKENYAFCRREYGIREVYIDFKKNATSRRAKSDIWREKLELWKENHQKWHENYRFRAIVEGIFSTIKKKSLNYLRSKNPTARDVEILAKCLVYNFSIIGRYRP